MNRTLKYVLLIIIVQILLLSLVQYFLTNQLATKGGELAKLLEEESTLRANKLVLSAQIAKLTALSRIKSESERVGLVLGQGFLTFHRVVLAQKPEVTDTIR